MWWFLACAQPDPTPAVAPAPVEVSRPPLPPLESSGAMLQDPTGFPRFHEHPAPPGPLPGRADAWTGLAEISGAEGGLRPQIASGPDGTLHLVYYAQTAEGDLLRHRVRAPAAAWSAPAPFGQPTGRNWGPDLVVRAAGSAVVSWDHTDTSQGFAGQVYLSEWRGAWSVPEALTPLDGREVGSAHVADAGDGDDLAVAWIERRLEPGAPFRAVARWRLDGSWTEPTALGEPSQGECWHTNVERHADGSVMLGWDTGPGGGENRVWLARGEAGSWSAPQEIALAEHRGERPHFASWLETGGATALAAVWFHRIFDQPLHIWLGQAGQPTRDLAAGLGGFHFDPDVAARPDGSLVAVWGWDAGADAALLYSVGRGETWSPPARVADLPGATNGWKPGLPSISVTPDGVTHVVWAWWRRGESSVWYAHLPTG